MTIGPLMARYFNDDVWTLAFDFGFDWDGVEGNKAVRVRKFAHWCWRQGALPEPVARCRDLRPRGQ